MSPGMCAALAAEEASFDANRLRNALRGEAPKAPAETDERAERQRLVEAALMQCGLTLLVDAVGPGGYYNYVRDSVRAYRLAWPNGSQEHADATAALEALGRLWAES